MNSQNKKILITGLGNPGTKYANTPHNVGFRFIDFLCRQWFISSGKKKFNSEFFEDKMGDKSILLIKPMTFMNLSGNSVKPALKKNGIAIKEMIVVHDEVDMAPGKWGFKEGGGHRGHNGLRHIISCLGGNDFLRIRIGVGRPSHPDLAGFLLSPMSLSSGNQIFDAFPEILPELEREIGKI